MNNLEIFHAFNINGDLLSFNYNGDVIKKTLVNVNEELNNISVDQSFISQVLSLRLKEKLSEDIINWSSSIHIYTKIEDDSELLNKKALPIFIGNFYLLIGPLLVNSQDACIHCLQQRLSGSSDSINQIYHSENKNITEANIRGLMKVIKEQTKDDNYLRDKVILVNHLGELEISYISMVPGCKSELHV